MFPPVGSGEQTSGCTMSRDRSFLTFINKGLPSLADRQILNREHWQLNELTRNSPRRTEKGVSYLTTLALGTSYER
jgi:hypothetical protein